jgi:hypothetical protein
LVLRYNWTTSSKLRGRLDQIFVGVLEYMNFIGFLRAFHLEIIGFD